MMTELLLIFLICLVGAEALQRRQQSELAERLIRHYCQNNDLQLLSVARQSFGIPLLLARVTQKANAFVFEYSADGVSKAEGELYLTGLHQPVFRFNESESTNSHQSGSSGVVINMPLQPPTRDESVTRTDSNNVIPFRRQPH